MAMDSAGVGTLAPGQWEPAGTTKQRGPGAVRRRAALGVGTALPALPALLALCAVACSPGERASGGSPLAPLTKEPITLRFMQRAAPEEGFAHKYGEEFGQQYPNVKIAFEETPTPDYWTKILAILASDQLPDLLWAWSAQGRLASYANAGVFRPLDDVVKADKYDLGQFYGGAIEADRWEGKLWALPTVGHPGEVTLFYNQNLLDAANVKYPDLATSLDDVVAAGRRAMEFVNSSRAEGNKIWGYNSGRGYFQMIIRMRAFAGDLFSADGKKITLNIPAAKAAVQWGYDAIGKHRISPSPAEAKDVSFPNGNLALFSSNVATVSTWRTTIGDRFKWAPTLFPVGPSGKRSTSLHTNTLHLSRQTKHVAESWELMKVLVSHEVGVQKVLMNSGTPGARPDVWNDPRLHGYEPFYKIGATLMPDARPHPVAYNLKTPDILDAFEAALPDIWSSKVSAATGVEQITQALQALLDRPR
jgi:ABC-type glycerol-3-phosphate transport system substrate-binding protein